MQKSFHSLPPIDVAQRYTMEEAFAYLRLSRASVYKKVESGELVVLKDGRRTFVPGSEIVRLSRAPVQVAA